MAATVRLQHLSYPKRGYDLLADVSDQKLRNKYPHLPITHSTSSAMSTSFRQPKKLRVSFETKNIASSYASPVEQSLEKSPRRRSRRLAPPHESKRSSESNPQSLLPPSPPFEPDNSCSILQMKYDGDYHHSPLLTPKDEDDDENDDENDDEHNNENKRGLAPRLQCYFPNDEAMRSAESDQNAESILESNADYCALHAALRSLNSARVQMNRDISSLASMLLFHANNSDKSVAVEFFMSLIDGKLSLPQPAKIPSVPLIDWGKYHPYFALASTDFDDATAFLAGPMNLAVHMFDHVRSKRH